MTNITRFSYRLPQSIYASTLTKHGLRSKTAVPGVRSSGARHGGCIWMHARMLFPRTTLSATPVEPHVKFCSTPLSQDGTGRDAVCITAATRPFGRGSKKRHEPQFSHAEDKRRHYHSSTSYADERWCYRSDAVNSSPNTYNPNSNPKMRNLA